MITIADDFGRFESDPQILRGQLFALRDDVRTSDVLGMCKELHESRLVTFYEVGGKWFAQIEKWQERARCEKSRIPDNPLRNAAERCGTLPPSFLVPRSSPLAIAIGQVAPVAATAADGSGLKSKGNEGYHKDSRTVLHYLNEQCGRHFRETDTNLGFISARLEESGVTLQGVMRMVSRQCARWKGTGQEEYLRPETLFNKTKFDGYYAAKDLPANSGQQKGPTLLEKLIEES